MADRTNRQKLIHLHTGENRAPSASVLNYGEIAVMHNEEAPSLFIKTGDNATAQFIDKDSIEKLIGQKISGATQDDFLALKSYVDGLDEANDLAVSGLSGAVQTLEGVALTGAVINDVTGTVADNVVTVEIDAEDIEVGKAVTYSGASFIAADDSTADALQALSDKIKTIDGVVSESNHGHENKAVLDGIDATDVENWDNAFASAHTHENKALLDTYTQTEADLADAVSKKHEHSNASELDLIQSGDVAKWNSGYTALDGKVDKVEGKGLSTNDYTDAEQEKLAGLASGAQVNVIETVKVNGTALTVTDKAVDILVAEGTANGTVKVNGTDIAVHGLGSAAYQDTTAFDASGAAATAKSEVIGDATDSGDTLGKLEDRIDSLEGGQAVTMTAYTGSDAGLTDGYLKTYEFFQGGSSIGKVDIPKDLVVTSGQIVEVDDVKYLRLTIANQDAPVDIAVSDLVDVYTQGNGIEISTGNVISAKVVAGNGLSLDGNGIAMAAASANGAGAMSAADFEKLAGVASGAQVNTLEGVQVNGADLTPDGNKKVNVTITGGTNNGTIAVNGSDVAVTGLGSAAFQNANAFDESGAAATAKSDVIGDASESGSTLGALEDRMDAMDLGEHNVLEGVQVNGTDLAIDGNKKVNVTVAEGSANGTIAVNGSDVAVHGLGSAAYSAATDFDAAGAAEAASAAAITAVVGSASNSGNTLGALEGRMDAMDLGDHNVIETVKVNGTALTPDSDKAVDVTVAEGSTNGTIAVNGSDVAVHGLGSAAYSAATDFDAAGTAATEAAAASAAAVTSANSYTDAKVADYVSAATGDTLVSASVANNEVTVGATQALQDAVSAATNSLQGIETGKESGAQVNASRELDFSLLSIDCGEY